VPAPIDWIKCADASRQQIVSPQARDHQHIGIADALLQRGGIAYFEAVDAGVERQEALMQLVSPWAKQIVNLSCKRTLNSSESDVSRLGPDRR
jgi:hypothetical protein